MTLCIVSAWGRNWRKVNLVMFTAYIDDSGTSPTQPVAIASAFVISAKRILRLECEWRNLKEKEGFSEFHTSEMVAKNKKSEFADWEVQKQRRVFKRVREISKKYGIRPSASISFAVNKEDYDSIMPDDLRSGLGRDHYAWAIRHLVSLLDNWRLPREAGPLEYIFDWTDVGTPRRNEIETIMQQAEAKAVYCGKPGEYTNFSFRRRQDISALQCVDAIAWTCYTQALFILRGTPPHPLSTEAWNCYGGHLAEKGWLQAVVVTKEQLENWLDKEKASGNRTVARLVEWEKSHTYLE